MKAEAAARAASLLAHAWQIGGSVDAFPPDCQPRTIAEGMQIQAALAEELGLPHAGWKIGGTSAAARKALKLRGPIAGRVFRTRMFDSGAVLPGTAYQLRGVEGEFAFVLGRDLKPRTRPYTRAEVRDAIGALHPAIEVIDFRFTDWRQMNAASLTADMAGQAALVLGPAVRRWRTLDLRKAAVRMTANGRTIGEGTGADVLGDPVAALAWLANQLRRRGGLAAGEIVATGTCTGLPPAPAVSDVIAQFGRLGEVRLRFV
jgi:2-keto-4-pentenoate hydratase